MKYLGKLFVGVLLSILLVAPVMAFTFEKDNLQFTGEYNYEKKEIETLHLANIGGLSLEQNTSNVKVWEFLTTIGYKLSDNLVPYAILGTTYLNFDHSTRLLGEGFAVDVLGTEFRESAAFTYGGGARGELMKFDNGVFVNYDTRWLMFNTSSTDNDLNIANSYLSLQNKQKVTYGEFDLNLTANKTFQMTKFVCSLTPYVGVRYSHVDLLYKNQNEYFNTESETQGGMVSGLVGIGTEINKNWSASIGGIVGEETGISVKAAFNF